MSKSGIVMVLILLFGWRSTVQHKTDLLYLNFLPKFDQLPFDLNQNYTLSVFDLQAVYNGIYFLRIGNNTDADAYKIIVNQ
ncbi:hypothetical protein EZL74_10055 [Flavobacterium silvisoli]|uniref:Uncharacterized protein n=1 Tax=Flavobacterium silvisoli TaxID=2529433 RepID=A0A4Q9YTQ2_9FLAO|nr:hypothetical protein [Flavobacterium silvisoli]TBX66994.1 hypothetical protein EZL74_10055 [Flavobacterium silvisoli]